MDEQHLIDAILARKSIRNFLDKPVSKETIVSILESACRAPSAMNTQPWEFVVVTGEPLEQIKKENVERLRAKEPPSSEHSVVGWPHDSEYRRRQVDLAKALFGLMDIAREDKAKRAQWLERGFRFFNAPVAVLILTDKRLTESGPLLDLGAAMQTMCLAALQYGLGTCIEDQGVMYPDIVRRYAKIPDDKRLVIAVALGYPDPDFPANRLESPREPVENLTTWIGFADSDR